MTLLAIVLSLALAAFGILANSLPLLMLGLVPFVVLIFEVQRKAKAIDDEFWRRRGVKRP